MRMAYPHPGTLTLTHKTTECRITHIYMYIMYNDLESHIHILKCDLFNITHTYMYMYNNLNDILSHIHVYVQWPRITHIHLCTIWPIITHTYMYMYNDLDSRIYIYVQYDLLSYIYVYHDLMTWNHIYMYTCIIWPKWPIFIHTYMYNDLFITYIYIYILPYCIVVCICLWLCSYEQATYWVSDSYIEYRLYMRGASLNTLHRHQGQTPGTDTRDRHPDIKGDSLH